MSIASEISRLQDAKLAIKTAIENKGVSVGNGAIDTYADKINNIVTGGATNVASGSFVLDENYTSSDMYKEINLDFSPSAVAVFRKNWVKGVQSINLTFRNSAINSSICSTASSNKAGEKFVNSSYIQLLSNGFRVTGNTGYYLVSGVEYGWIACE